MRRPALVPLLLLPLVAAAAIAEERKLTITESTAVAADGTRIYYRVAGSGNDVVQIGTRPDGTVTRWTFTEITDDSFHWLGEALQPDGKNWKLEGEFRAKRVRMR